MYRANGSLDWRAVGAVVALLIGVFTLTGYLTDDKIDSKVQQHELRTETKQAEDMAEIKQTVSALQARQEMLIQQNEIIIRKIDRLDK